MDHLTAVQRVRAAGTEHDGSSSSISDEQLFRMLARIGRKAKPKRKVMALQKSLPSSSLGHGGVHRPGDKPTETAVSKKAAAAKPAKRLVLPDGPQLTPAQALERLQAAVATGKVSGHDGVLIERVIHSGGKLPANIRKLLAGV